jgi:putative SOS response-associated peptidase YedK
VFESKAFAQAARRRRCLVPAAGWYEWKGSSAPKQPYVFHLDGFVPFAFAGIWTGRKLDDDWHRSYAILTNEAAGPLREIHHRKPVVLRPEHYRRWMDAATDEAEARELLEDTLDGIVAYAVSDHVNKPANNDAQCIQPLEEAGFAGRRRDAT